MHVALFSPALPSTGWANGIVTYTRIMQAALGALGHHATVFGYDGIEYPDGRIEKMLPDRSWPNRIGRYWARLRGQDVLRRQLGLRHIIKAIDRHRPIDVLEMEESFGWVGRLGLDVPVVARLHGPHFLGREPVEQPHEKRFSDNRVFAEKRGIAAVQGITSPSAKLMHATLAHYGLQANHAAAIPNPMPIATPDRRWSAERCDPDQLLFVGRFDLRKGADIALDAFALAAAHNPALRLVMCGPDTGLQQESGERIHFKDYVADRLPPAVRERVSFLGAVGPDRVERLRQQSALCLSTSRFETFSYSLAEGLSTGMPVLASETFGIAELIEHGVDGFIAPVGDAEAVARVIGSALADRGRLAAVGAAGRARCAALLSPRLVAERTVAFYRSIL